MATTLISEENIKIILEMGLDPEPIIISKGGYYSIANYTLGENLEIITESGPAPAYFYEQIYNPEMIKNLILSPGVTLELTRDIFINGQFTNLGGTVTGGQIYEVDRDLILSGMSYSWESDLGVTNETDFAIDCKSANNEYLSFSPITLQDGQEINFTFYLPDFSVQRFLGAMNDASTYIVIQTNGSAFVQLLVGGIVIPIGQLTIGLNTIKLRESAGTYYFSANGGTEYTIISASTFSMEQISRRSGSARDLELYNFDANSETFPCNEGTGSTTTGSLGTVATLNSTGTVDDMWIDISGVQSWVDNIASVSLEAPNPTQRPLYSSADADFKNLPSLAGESINNRYLTASNLSLGGGDKLTVYCIINNSAVSFVGGQQAVHSLISASSTNYRQFLGDNGGNHYFEVTSNFQNLSNISTIPNATQSTILSMDGSKTTDELTAYLNGVGDGHRGVNNNSSPVFNVSSFFAFVQSNLANPTDAKLPIILIYPEVHDTAKRNEIEQYLNNKYIA